MEKLERITDLLKCLKKVFVEATTPGNDAGEWALVGDYLWEMLEKEFAEVKTEF